MKALEDCINFGDAHFVIIVRIILFIKRLRIRARENASGFVYIHVVVKNGMLYLSRPQVFKKEMWISESLSQVLGQTQNNIKKTIFMYFF
jgi:hypothetical protein